MPERMTLRYVPRDQFAGLWSPGADSYVRSALFADMCRLNALYMIMRAGSGHIGTSFSSLDIVSWLHLEQLGLGPGEDEAERGVYMSSKGHDAPALYAVLWACGRLDGELIHRLRRREGLPGHPDVGTPGMSANTGSLGMGISKAKGMVEAARLAGTRRPVFVLTGDGELQEGQIWESLQGARNRQLGEITVVVDHNKIQSDTWVRDVSDLGDLEAKFRAFGWNVARCDGHDLRAFDEVLRSVRADDAVPGVVIADTVKGRGVSFMEGIDSEDGLYHFHSGAPPLEVFDKAFDEILDRANAAMASLGGSALEPETVEVPARAQPKGQRLVTAYSRALVDQGERDGRIVVLDADLVLDCGLIPFAQRFPERFIECGIAEQDMVSQAGGLALSGRLPIVHSFACFLAARPAEQIYTNATERTKVVYVGSLAGVVPGGPGHSHQAVRDISLVSAVPGLVAVEPSTEDEVAALLDVCLHEVPGSVYFRLVTAPIDVPFRLPSGYRPVPGQGVTVRSGPDGVV
ncbi:MAG: transketolase, partial [Actinomycetota bacterium]|nr:transketolase [Actinomycetota bacterium]